MEKGQRIYNQIKAFIRRMGGDLYTMLCVVGVCTLSFARTCGEQMCVFDQ